MGRGKFLLYAISCTACLGLEHVHGEKMGGIAVSGKTQLRDPIRNLIENVHGDSFRAWVLVKNRHVVQVRVVERLAYVPESPFQHGEIQEHAAVIELVAFYMREYLVIMPVQILTLAVIVP